MKALVLTISYILTILIVFGCSQDQPIQRTGMVLIDTSILPDTIVINENASAAIRVSAENGCWNDLYVDFKKINTYEYSLKAYGTFSCYEGGCACPAVMVYHDTLIDFQLNQSGTYIFNIQKSRDNIITDTVIVK